MPLKRFSDLLLVCCCVFGVLDDYLLALKRGSHTEQEAQCKVTPHHIFTIQTHSMTFP